MKKLIPGFLIILVIALFSARISATPLVDNLKGSDLVNAAKLVLSDSTTPESGEEKLLSIYAVGFIEGVIASDIQKEATGVRPVGDFNLGAEGEIGVMKLIIEYVDASPSLSAAPGAPLLHALLCIRYGSTREIQTKGSRILMGLSATEGRKVVDELSAARKKAEEEMTTPSKPSD